MNNEVQKWFVYILRCSDNTLYTGITTDLKQRLHEHNHSPKGAKYTRGRRPVILLYFESYPSRSAAASREYQIKRFTSKQKKQLIGKFEINAVDYLKFTNSFHTFKKCMKKSND